MPGTKWQVPPAPLPSFGTCWTKWGGHFSHNQTFLRKTSARFTHQSAFHPVILESQLGGGGGISALLSLTPHVPKKHFLPLKLLGRAAKSRESPLRREDRRRRRMRHVRSDSPDRSPPVGWRGCRKVRSGPVRDPPAARQLRRRGAPPAAYSHFGTEKKRKSSQKCAVSARSRERGRRARAFIFRLPPRPSSAH